MWERTIFPSLESALFPHNSADDCDRWMRRYIDAQTSSRNLYTDIDTRIGIPYTNYISFQKKFKKRSSNLKVSFYSNRKTTGQHQTQKSFYKEPPYYERSSREDFHPKKKNLQKKTARKNSLPVYNITHGIYDPASNECSWSTRTNFPWFIS